MTDAAIKKALEVAGWAECEARAKVNECDEGRCPRAAPCQWCAAGAAAAIAAFLRALPDAPLHLGGLAWDSRMSDGSIRENGPRTLHRVAAAVERAAGGGE